VRNIKLFIVSLKDPQSYTLFLLFIIGFLLILAGNTAQLSEQQFVYLANSFINGKLFFLETPSLSGWADTSLYNGNYYWPLGIFPAILLIPFALIFKLNFSQGSISIVLNFINFVLLFLLAKRITSNTRMAHFLTFSYMFGTAYLFTGTISFSWYFAHIVVTSCFLFALYFLIVKPKPLLAGMFFTFTFLTRISTSLGILFFIFYYLRVNKKPANLSKFLLPVSVGIGVFFLYNYLRFENIFETGYSYQLLPSLLSANREIGMWSLKHFPANLYYFLISPPSPVFIPNTRVITGFVPNHRGMGILFTSPILFFVTRANFKDKLNIGALIGLIPIALFLFGSFGIGYRQYGYRFALDFQPLLYLILCSVFRDKRVTYKLLFFIALSCLFNIFMIISYFR
jgi:hypothetical protein